MATITLIPNGTGSNSGWDGKTGALHLEVDDYSGGGAHDSDSSYIEASSGGTCFLLLTNTPNDFDPSKITSISITKAYRGVPDSDLADISWQIYRANESTAITNRVETNNIINTYAEGSHTLTQQGSHTKEDWDGARIQIVGTQEIGPPPTLAQGWPRITAVKVSVTYDSSKVIAVGQATSSHTAQPITRKKQKGIAQATETDLAQVITRSTNPVKIVSVGQITETDTAQAITPLRSLVVPALTGVSATSLTLSGVSADALSLTAATPTNLGTPEGA